MGKLKAIKAIFFDMDGVLFNSMPYHAEAWVKALDDFDFEFSEYEVYLNEGRTGFDTVNEVYLKKHGKEADICLKQKILDVKSDYFNEYPPVEQIPDVFELLKFLKGKNLNLFVVTGSAQMSVIGRLNENFPDIFDSNNIITALDVERGKPNPEPYLLALQRAKVDKAEVIIVENAPLGIMAGVAAEIFTIGVNTGILNKEDLVNAGANIVFDNMKELKKWFDR